MYITQLFHTLLFALTFSPICIFIHIAFTREGMLFYEAGNFFEALLPDWMAKPLFTCPTCMASVWGTFFWSVTGGSISLWWVAAVMALAGVNTVIGKLVTGNQ